MRTAHGWFCDTRNNEEYPGCEQDAAVAWTCTIEGRQIALCGSCDRAWRSRAANDDKLRHRCPLCAYAGIAVSTGTDPNITTVPLNPVLAGELAEAIDSAMFSEGLLIDVRKRVLRRLAADERMRETVLHA